MGIWNKHDIDANFPYENLEMGKGSSNLIGVIYNNNRIILNVSYFKENSLIKDGKISEMNTEKNSSIEFLLFDDVSLNFSYLIDENFNLDGSRNSLNRQYTFKNDYRYNQPLTFSITYFYSEIRDVENSTLDSNLHLYGFLISYVFR